MDRPRAPRGDRSRIPHPVLALAFTAAPAFGFVPSGRLEIHHVNVQQGDCTLIIGPDGTTLLIDAGDAGKGSGEVVPYLQSLGLLPSDGIDYVLNTHRDSDHLGGLDEVIAAGYDVRFNLLGQRQRQDRHADQPVARGRRDHHRRPGDPDAARHRGAAR